jgi:hypothetical protein
MENAVLCSDPAHHFSYGAPGNMQQQYLGMIQPQEMNELQGWFRAIDKDNSGHITANELMGVRSYFHFHICYYSTLPQCHPP